MARGRGRGRIGAPAHGARSRGGARKSPGRGKGGVSPLTRQATAQAGTEYNPGIREAREEAKGSRKREQDLGSWYAQLAADYGQAQAAGASALGSVAAVTSQQQKEASERSGAEQAELAKSDEAFANLTGGPKDTEGLAKIAAAGAAAERARVDEAKLPVSEQADFVARLGSDKTAARLGGIEARQTEARNREKLKSNIGAQRREKAAARVADKTKLSESAREAAIEAAKLKLAQREAGASERASAASSALAQAEAARTAAQDAIGNRQAQERIGIEKTNAAISAKNARTSARSQRATARHYRKENKGGLTPTQRRAAKREHASAAVTATNLYKAAKKPPTTAAGWAAFTQLVASEEGIDPVAAEAAVARLRKALAAQERVGRDVNGASLGR